MLVFPESSGIAPIYIVYSESPRKKSGVVTGYGENITGIWLEQAGKGLGAPIPSQIADKLRGREFSSFDAFRKAFWMEVAKDEQLSNQFNGLNLNTMKNGRAPFCKKSDRVGGRVKFEVHHAKEIQFGGEVYDIENLKVTTPRNHINIHKAK